MELTERVVLTNMCMVKDTQGRYLLQDRMDPGWPGLVFPGGHVEKGETPLQAAKRELYEETGITDCRLIPLWDYEVIWDDGIHSNNGRVYLALARSLGTLPESEMERIGLFSSVPEPFTYDRETEMADLETVMAFLGAEETQI